jgi:hypothetical protein
MIGQPMKYRRDQSKNGRFLLYSIGWDERDDEGKISENEGSGDWIWHNIPRKAGPLQ